MVPALRRIHLQVTLPQGASLGKDPGSILHGVLLEQLAALDPDTTNRLHSSGDSVRPFTQGVVSHTPDGFVWQITTLQEVFRHFLEGWLQQLPPSIHLRQCDCRADLSLLSTPVPPLSYQELVEEHFVRQPPPRRIGLQFLSPTAFRSSGDKNYLLFPEPRLLWQNALRKWEAFCPDYRLGDPDLAEDLAQICTISRYRLETVPVNLGGARLAGFVGMVQYSLSGSEEGRRLIALLADYLTYCGAGIKTALGMGLVYPPRKISPEQPLQKKEQSASEP